MSQLLCHRMVKTNGIRMHFAEQGDGPLVILCHGFPESWYSWRHQLYALADAGFHVVAPDQRGYGETDRPDDASAYTLCHLAGDIVGLIHALGEKECVIVGHDWGAPVAWNCALLRPDLIRAVALLSVPFLPNFYDGPVPTEGMKKLSGADMMFYQLYIQEPGKVEAELELDVQASMLGFLYAASATPAPEHRWRFLFPRSQRFIDTMPVAPDLPPWLNPEDLTYFTREFERTGFRGGLNWYRNLDRNRELLAFLKGSLVRQPSLFLAGSEDAVITMYREAYEKLEQSMPDLRAKVLIPDAGHWVQQEKPAEVNRRLLAFLASVYPEKARSAAEL
jgi:pimeloyl-ACP methyl ester carboxylesterase